MTESPRNSIGSESTAGGSEDIQSLGDLLTQRQRKRFKAGDRLLERYRILGELGQGGMGLVFRCLDEIGGIEVAVKMLPPEVGHDSGEMEDVRENFRLVSSLVHQNICAVRTLEKDPATGEYFLVMELAQGVNLRQWRKQKKAQYPISNIQSPMSKEGRARLPGAPGSERGALGQDALPEILPIVRQIASALDYAHENKVIHRDVKPSNVMVQPATSNLQPAAVTVKVLDFGLAAQIHTSFSRVSHVRYGTSGTGPYMAPEQWEGQYQDAATDQYALAVLTYELLTGHCPFESHETTVLRESVLKSAPKCPPGLPAAAWAALRRGLAKEREERFASCGEFARALGGEKILPPRAQRAQRKGRSWKWVAGLVLLAGVASGAWFFLGRDGALSKTSPSGGRRPDGAGTPPSRESGGPGVDRAKEGPPPDSPEADRQEGVGAPKAEQPSASDVALVEVAPLRDKAEVCLEEVRALDRGQGLGEYIDRCEEAWSRSETMFSRNDYPAARTAFETAIQLCELALVAGGKRSAAEEDRSKAETQRKNAHDGSAVSDAAELWDGAELAWAEGSQQFEDGDFEKARQNWQTASREYGEALAMAQQIQADRERQEEQRRQQEAEREAKRKADADAARMKAEEDARRQAESQNRAVGSLSGVNVAMRKPVSSSSFYEPNVAANSVDGREDTRWVGNAYSGWLAIDLQNEYELSRIVLKHRETGDQWWERYALSTSRDGTTWTTVANGLLKGVQDETVDFVPRSVRYIRFQVANASEWAVLTELEAYGPSRAEETSAPRATTNVALGKPTAASRSWLYTSMGGGGSERAVDGDVNTLWNAGDLPRNDWLQLDLQRPVDVSRIAVVGNTHENSWETINLEGSLDGRQWRLISQGRLKGGIDRLDVVVNDRFQYIRCIITAGICWAHLAEIEVYGL